MGTTATAQEGNATHHFGFVMEQTLGHVTHYRNLRAIIDADSAVRATWYPLTFPPRGTLETLPGLRGNWSVRASWRARQALAPDASAFSALFFHTQVSTLLSVDVMRRVPSVVSLDATPMNYDKVGGAYGHEKGRGLAEGLKRALNRRALHAAGALVTWCDWARQSLIDDYGVDGTRITVIPPGVNLDLWPCPLPKVGSDPVRILFVGANFARKGGETLLRAFAAMPGSCELHIVTQAPVAPAPGVHIYRDVAPNSDLLRRLYAQADLFVLPTLADCFPLVIQEAMAAGLPVIASDVGAIREAIADGATGLLIAPGDVQALGAAIETLARDPARREEMGRRGRAVAEQRFDLASNTRRILTILRALAREGAVR